MSEEKKPEKWERKEWFVFTRKPKTANKRTLRKLALAYGNISLKVDHLSIGDFSLNYSDILEMELSHHYTASGYQFILIHVIKGITYWITYISFSIRLDGVFPIFREKLKQYEKIKISEAISFIKDLPNLYREINLDDLASRTHLDKGNLMEIIENLISGKELNAEIRGNILKFRREAEILVSPKGYTSETSISQEVEKREGMLIFVSYATKDAELYKIPELAHKLESYKEIGEVLYWQEDMHDSIIEYMNDNLGRCDVVLLFCSPNALDSVPVKKEWMAAESLNKPIIPIFFKPEHIPPLLNDRLGVEFNNFDFQKNVQEMYELILKKKES
ncbi:MAG: toll/interleukin-1 receptor domain-containing protein [Promethearchaeota archaeon]